MNNNVPIPSIYATRQQDDVWIDGLQLRHRPIVQLLAIHLDDLGARSQSGAVCRLRCEMRDQPYRYHPQPTRGAGACQLHRHLLLLQLAPRL